MVSILYVFFLIVANINIHATCSGHRFISDELRMIQAFLRAADGAQENTGVLKAYLELIRDLAYDIEDCFEEFRVFIKHKSLLQQLLHLGARHRIAVQIRTLKQRIQEASHRNKRYNLKRLTPSTSTDEMTRNLTPLYVEEAQLVGLEEQKKKLMELITRPKEPSVLQETSNAGPTVVSLVGMGGLGKTTLAKKVYDSKELRGMFSSFAWISVSQSFSMMELLKDMIKQLFGANSLNTLLEENKGLVLQVHHLTSYPCRR
jgi:disease resistance protein RPM1